METGVKEFYIPVAQKVSYIPLVASTDEFEPFEATFENIAVKISFTYMTSINLYNLRVKVKEYTIPWAVTGEVLQAHNNPIGYLAYCVYQEARKLPEELTYSICKAYDMFFKTQAATTLLNKDKWKNSYSAQTHSFKNAKFYVNSSALSVGGESLAGMSTELPGVQELVKHPVTGRHARLFDTIMDLNDHHRWTREKIADWIESLDIDTKFKVKEETT